MVRDYPWKQWTSVALGEKHSKRAPGSRYLDPFPIG